jgi:DNA repair protein RadC
MTTAYAQNTPGFDYRAQFAFTNKDAVGRAWQPAVATDGKAFFVPVSLEMARGYVEKGLADELPGGSVTDAQRYGRQVPLAELDKDCGCEHAPKVAGIVDVDVAQVTAVKGRGRLVVAGEPRVREPLLAVSAAEGGPRVACCGAECGSSGATPAFLAFDTYEGGAAGYHVKSSSERALPERLAKRYSSRGEHHCLPWVRVERDPESFRACLAQAQAYGPVNDSHDVHKLLGPFLMKQDQEVFLVLMLDVQLQVRGVSEIARGARDKVDVPVPDVLRVAIVEGSTAIVVVHNHPSGVVKPSDSDVELTETLEDAAEQVHLCLLDHVIVGGDRHYSFAKSKKLGDYAQRARKKKP